VREGNFFALVGHGVQTQRGGPASPASSPSQARPWPRAEHDHVGADLGGVLDDDAPRIAEAVVSRSWSSGKASFVEAPGRTGTTRTGWSAAPKRDAMGPPTAATRGAHGKSSSARRIREINLGARSIERATRRALEIPCSARASPPRFPGWQGSSPERHVHRRVSKNRRVFSEAGVGAQR